MDPTSPLLTLLQLQRRARQAATPQALGFVAVNETLQLVPFRQAALWTEAGLGQVAAVSGLPQSDPTAPYVQWLGAACRHLMRGHVEAGAVEPEQLPEPLRIDWAQWLPAHVLWLPLGREGEPAQGGLLLARDAPWDEHSVALLKELAHAYGHALAGFAPRQNLFERTLSSLRTARTQRWLIIGALVLCLTPMRLTVLAPSEVVPADPFMVRAPLEGVIDRFDVKPNQPVKTGTPLFSLDTTALRSRLEIARKAVDTAQEEYRQSAQMAVTSDKNRAEMALRRGKLEEKAVELDYTASQLDRIQVKAERDGIAVFADTHDWIGKAVNVGERVLVVADPSKVELLAWLPSGDQIALAPGDTLTFYPQGSPLNSFGARVLSVSYRAEATHEGFMAYRIKAAFAPGEAAPRLGQLGASRLHGGWAPLIYVALRRPLVTARQWLGW